MATTTIENPVINSPFEEPQRHYRFTDTGITNKVGDDILMPAMPMAASNISYWAWSSTKPLFLAG